MRKILLITISLGALLIVSGWRLAQIKREPKTVSVMPSYLYVPVPVVPDQDTFHSDFDSTYIDQVNDCLHYTFKLKHKCNETN